MKEFFTTIRMDNFDSEIKEGNRPLLLACILRGDDFKEQIKVLESVSKRYYDALKVCLLDEDCVRSYKKLGIVGTPTFLILYKGKEMARKLGKVDMETLSSFVLRVWTNFQEDNEQQRATSNEQPATRNQQ